jgi:hypothetical protein
VLVLLLLLPLLPGRCEVCRELVPAEYDVEQQYKDKVEPRYGGGGHPNTLGPQPTESAGLWTMQSASDFANYAIGDTSALWNFV